VEAFPRLPRDLACADFSRKKQFAMAFSAPRCKSSCFFDYKLYLLFQGSGELLNLMFTPGNVSGRHRCSAGDEHPFQYKKYPPAP
jgi:hypothetical protein